MAFGSMRLAAAKGAAGRALGTITYICVLLVLLAGCAKPSEPIEVTDARAPATPPNATVAAVYMEITAHEPDRLLGASSKIAHSVEVHHTSIEDGISKMRPVEAIALDADQTVAFAPGGTHFMMVGIGFPFEPGQTFELELQFERAGIVRVEVPVIAPGDDHAHH